MCLSIVWTDEEMEAWLADQPEVIEVEKFVAVSTHKTHYVNLYRDCSFACSYASGLDRACPQWPNKAGLRKYWPNFHFYLPDNGSTPWSHCVKIKCLIKKDWVTAIGTEYQDTVIVTSRAVFPHYPEVSARYEDIQPFLEKAEVKDEVPV